MAQQESRYTATVESVDGGGSGVQLEFNWFGDRFGHEIRGLNAGKPVPLLRSLEGESEEVWPFSPPLQEFNDPYVVSDFNCGQARLAIGSAGSAHWAISIEVAEANVTPAITFDVACRTKEFPKWLGSSYELLNCDEMSCGLSRVDFSTSNGNYRVRAEDRKRHPELVDCLLGVTDDRVTLTCQLPDDMVQPTTYRWR